MGSVGGQALGCCCGHTSCFQVASALVPQEGPLDLGPEVRWQRALLIAWGRSVGLHGTSSRHRVSGRRTMVSEPPLPGRMRRNN